jgi:hypothetical protein
MNIPVSLDELVSAHEWVSAGEAAGLDCAAYVSKLTGKVHWCGEGVDEEPPDDIEDESLYVAVPHKTEFDLGHSLAIRFVEEHLPRERETVREYFRQRGAYSKLKSLLIHVGQLDAWHQYEQAATEIAMRQWCTENGFNLVP